HASNMEFQHPNEKGAKVKSFAPSTYPAMLLTEGCQEQVFLPPAETTRARPEIVMIARMIVPARTVYPMRARRAPVRLAIAANAAIDDGRAATPAAAIVRVVIAGSAIGDRRADGHARDQRYADSGGSGAEIVV